MATKHLLIDLMMISSLVFTACYGEKGEESQVSKGSKNTEAQIREPGADNTLSAPTTKTTETDSAGAEIPNTYTDQYGNIVYTIVEQKPTFEGGETEYYEFLKSHLNYPEKAFQKRVEGIVHITFVVSKDGTIKNVELASGLEESSLNEEAMRVVSQMPNWIPGVQNGKPVDVKYTLPVKFELIP